MVGTRTLACAALVLALAGCSGSSLPPSPPTSSTTQHTSHPGSQLTLNALPPIDLQGSVSGGDNGRVRILQNERKAAVGTSVSLLAVPGVGTLHVRCAQAPTTSFVLTSWAKGEGPPRVQHFNSLISRPVAFIPLNQLGIPPLAGKSGGPESYDVWQVGVFSEAFSGTATVWAIGGASGGHCQLEAEALLVTHGAWSRYAPAHG